MKRELYQSDYKFNHLEIGHPDNPKPYRICGAHTTSENSKGDICLLKAGYDTYHPGTGRCKFHGGSKPMRYGSDRYIGRLRDHIVAMEKDDTNPLDILPELQVQRVMLSLALDKLDESPLQPGPREVAQIQTVGNVGSDNDSDDVSDGNVMMVGGGGVVGYDDMGTLDIRHAGFSTFSASNSSIKQDNLSKAKMRLVRTEDVELVRELSADIVNTVTKIIATRNQTALTKAEIVYLLATMREAIGMFVEKDKQEAFVKYLLERIPIVKAEEGVEDV
jgi:hypothetical protein